MLQGFKRKYLGAPNIDNKDKNEIQLCDEIKM